MINKKKIKDLPDGSGSLTADDVFLFMDNPSGGGVTKKISLSQVADSIWNSDLPTIINASVAIKIDTKANLDAYVIPSGELVYATDQNSLRIGDGNTNGGNRIIPESYYVAINSSTSIPRSGNTVSLDPQLQINVPSPASGTVSYFRGRCLATFIPTETNPITQISPIVGLDHIPNAVNIEVQAGSHSLSSPIVSDSQEMLRKNYWYGETSSPYASYLFDAPSKYITASNNSNVFYYENYFNFISRGSGTIGLYWASSNDASTLLVDGLLEIIKVK